MSCHKFTRSEEWRPVMGYEGVYSVSDLGRVRRDSKGSGAKAGRILKPGSSTGGYPTVHLYRDGVSRPQPVHRLVAGVFHGAPLPGQVVNHLNGDKLDASARNLEWTTPSGNARHAYATGLKPSRRGIPSPRTLTPDAVREIRASGETTVALGVHYGVHPTTITHVRTRRRWGHIE